MRRAYRLALVFLTSSVPWLAPQAAAGQAQAEPPQAVFRSGIELVRLDVRVVDGDGRPVKDLRQDEIEVLENGRPRPIVQFQHIAEPAGSYVEVARRTIGSEVSTNRGAPRGHLYVLVFDQAHITPGNEQRARLAAERFLKTRLRPGDRVALYALPGPGPQVAFTSNVDYVLSELPKIRGGLDRQEPGSIVAMSVFEAYEIIRGDLGVLERVATRASEQAAADLRPVIPRVAAATEALPQLEQLVKSNAQTVVDRADSSTRSFLLMLSDVVHGLAGIEGRKSVVLFSEGFFADNLPREIEQVAAEAAKSYAVFYSFDLNERGVNGTETQPQGGEHQAEIQSRLESLGALAGETDGELVVDARSRLDAALGRIADQSQDYYLVAFEPPPEATGDRSQYHRIKVRVRRAGARLSVRTGYALHDPLSAADRRRAIDRALHAPFPQQALPLDVTTYVMRGPSSGVHRVILCLQADLPVARGSQARTADVVFVAKSARDGRIVASGTDTMPLPRGPAPGRTTALSEYQGQFEAPPGEYLMRVVVREAGGEAGSVDRRFEVRNFDGTDITASDMVLGRRPGGGLPVRAVGYTGDVLSGVFEIYGRRRADLQQVDAEVQLTPLDSMAPVTSVKADLLEVQQVGIGASRGAQIAVPLKGVPPGEYVATAVVRAHGETATQLMREVEVVAGAVPALSTLAPISPPTPAEILQGDLARRFIASLRAGSTDPVLVAAADEAARGAWAKVSALLASPSGNRPAAFHALRGLALFAGQQYDQAAGELQRAFTLDSKSPLAAFFLGWARAWAGNDTGAVSAWRAATFLQPTLVSAYLALADMYMKLAHRELAVQVLREGLNAVQGSRELQGKLAEIERRKVGL